jgi:hypothetical protein
MFLRLRRRIVDLMNWEGIHMNPVRRTAFIAGWLWIVTFVASIPAYFVFYARSGRSRRGFRRDLRSAFLIGHGFFAGLGNGLILGYLMFRSGLVPRGMAILGLIGGPLLMASGIAIMLDVTERGSSIQGIATIPEAFWELSLGIYLIVKGFKLSDHRWTAGRGDGVILVTSDGSRSQGARERDSLTRGV